ncbi:MAG: universal stress protein [Vicinamibacterales bacterium]
MSRLRTVIAAVDFSDSSRRILVLAARLARKHGAVLHVLASVPTENEPGPADPAYVRAAVRSAAVRSAAVRSAAVRRAGPQDPPVGDHSTLMATRDALRRLVAEVPDLISPCLDVIAGSPTSTILNAAEREDADLVVMAADHGCPSGTHIPGAVAQHVLLNARRSILVVPSSWTPPAVGIGLAPIVVGVDATEPGLGAGRLAAELARTLETTVEAVHVVPYPEVSTELERLLHIVAPTLDGLRVEVGDVVERLATIAAPVGMRRPLLVIGRRGHGGPEAMPGSTAERLAALGTIPLLMYRPA